MTLENVIWSLCLPCCPAGSDTALCLGKHPAQLSEERLGFGNRVPLAARHPLENVAAALIDPSGLVLATLLCSTGAFPSPESPRLGLPAPGFLVGTGRTLIPWECKWYSLLLLLAGAF